MWNKYESDGAGGLKETTFASVKAEFEKEVDKLNDKFDERKAEMDAKFLERMSSLRTYVPPVQSVDYQSGRFMRLNSDHENPDKSLEIPCQYIESIEVRKSTNSNGSIYCYTGKFMTPIADEARMPSDDAIRQYVDKLNGDKYDRALSDLYRPRIYGPHYNSGRHATIEVTMSSGQKHHITCWPERLDIMLDAMRKTWKGDHV